MENGKIKHYKYLIIGGGMASFAAIKGIRSIDKDSGIGVINEEEFDYYKRPWLSKKLWNDKPLDEVWLRVNSENIDFFNKKSVVKVDPGEKIITDNFNDLYSYEKLLIASGGSPKKLPGFEKSKDIIYFRNLDDYFRLKEIAQEGKRIVVIGGSFIGSEIAAALTLKKCDVTMIFPETGLCSKIFPSDLSSFLNDYYEQKGVKIINKDEVINCKYMDINNYILTTKNKKIIEADAVVLGIGIKPNIDFLKDANLNMDDNEGIRVNKYLITNNPSIYAAGDVSSFYYSQISKYIRFEHEDNALSMGEIAGKNMAGNDNLEYDHFPFFYSDLFDLGYEAIGDLNSEYDIITKWEEEFKKGRLFYLKDNKIRGILLWNVWDEVEKAGKFISENNNISFNNANKIDEEYFKFQL